MTITALSVIISSVSGIAGVIGVHEECSPIMEGIAHYSHLRFEERRRVAKCLAGINDGWDFVTGMV